MAKLAIKIREPEHTLDNGHVAPESSRGDLNQLDSIPARAEAATHTTELVGIQNAPTDVTF